MILHQYLAHHGVLGMKWGIRKSPELLGRSTSSNGKSKSKHRMNLEDKYKSKGMTDIEAEKAANKRINIEKVLAATAAMTVVAATAYVTKNEYAKNWTETKLAAGTIFK